VSHAHRSLVKKLLGLRGGYWKGLVINRQNAHAKVQPGGMTSAGGRDGAMGVQDDGQESQVARSSCRREPIDHR